MRSALLASVSSILIIFCGFGCTRTRTVYYDQFGRVHEQRQRVKLYIKDLADEGGGLAHRGTWTGDGDWPDEARGGDEGDLFGVWIEIRSENNYHSRQTMVPRKDVTWRPVQGVSGEGDEAVLTIFRPAGKIICTGSYSGQRGSGQVRLEPDTAYMDRLSIMLAGGIEPADVPLLMISGLELEYAGRMCRALAEKPRLDELLRLQGYGVTPEYATDLGKAGYSLPPGDLVELRKHGVSAEYAASLKKAGYDLSVEDLTTLRRHGVSEDFAGAARKAGYGRTVDELVEVRRHGISEGFLSELKAAGYDLPVGDVVQMRRHGISTEFAKGVRDAGYEFSINQMIELRRHGVSVEYLKSLHDPDQRDLTVEEIVELRRRGVDPEVVRKIRRP